MSLEVVLPHFESHISLAPAQRLRQHLPILSVRQLHRSGPRLRHRTVRGAVSTNVSLFRSQINLFKHSVACAGAVICSRQVDVQWTLLRECLAR
jgi:ribosomal protein S30